MIDLYGLQQKVYIATKNLGYIINKRNTLKKLKEEYKEFKYSRKNDMYMTEYLSNIKDDTEFKRMFDNHIKHTEHDELPDMFFVLLSYCEENDIDFEILVMNKLRYNKLRNK